MIDTSAKGPVFGRVQLGPFAMQLPRSIIGKSTMSDGSRFVELLAYSLRYGTITLNSSRTEKAKTYVLDELQLANL